MNMIDFVIYNAYYMKQSYNGYTDLFEVDVFQSSQFIQRNENEYLKRKENNVSLSVREVMNSIELTSTTVKDRNIFTFDLSDM